jgi:hypothetical protein
MADVTKGRGNRAIQELEKLLEIPDDNLVKWRSLKKVIKAVLRNAIIQGNNIKVTDTPDGQTVSALISDPGHPFKITNAIDGIGAPGAIFQPGTVEGLMPTIGGVAIDFNPAPVLSVSTDESPFFEMDIEPLVSNYGTDTVPNWRIVGGNVTAVRIIADTVPAGTPATVDRETGSTDAGVYYRRIGSQSAGLWSNAIRYSIDVSMCDDGGDLTGEGVISLGLSG